MEKEELLSLAGVVALLVAGDSDVSEDDGVSKLVSDGVVIPAEESEMVYPGDTVGGSTVPLSEIHPAMIIQVMSATEAAIEPMAIFFCRAFFSALLLPQFLEKIIAFRILLNAQNCGQRVSSYGGASQSLSQSPLCSLAF